jgi:hypothetical protein
MLNLVANGPSGYTINNSLRFRSSATAYLSRTFAATNGTTNTLSVWVKRGNIGARQVIFGWSDNSSNALYVQFYNDSIELANLTSGSTNLDLTTTQVFRDPSAWYHIVVVWDTTQATSTNRVRLYINGLQVTSFSTTVYPAQNASLQLGTSHPWNIGREGNTGNNPADMYMAEINFVDGQALTPSSFGSTNATTGVWQPAKYTGTYGTNGFYLKFSNIALTSGSNTGLGQDFSGNGNYWNTNNISVTAGSTYDAMTDVPTLTSATVANYATLNPVDNGGNTLSNANLNIVGAVDKLTRSTIGMSSGKWYCEYTVVATGGSTVIGVATALAPNSYVGSNSQSWGYKQTGEKLNNGTVVAYGASYTVGDVIGIALDVDTGTLIFYKNNTSQGTAFTGLTSGPYFYAIASANPQGAWNFGQRPFTYTPPSGYVALNTYNLPTPNVKKTNTIFDATLYTGTGATLSVTNAASFKPDFVWIKSRSAATDHALYDFVRGTTKDIASNLNTAETTQATGLTAFNTNGFTVGSLAKVNTSSANYVAWQWIGNGSSSSNSNGSITSTVDANPTAGFSIVTWTGTGSGTNTVGHGLGVAPKMILIKDRSITTDWNVYHVSLGNTAGINLNATNAAATNIGWWNNTSPTSNVFTNGTYQNLADNYVAYCFAEIAGFSKFGSYTGNGSADGPFLYLGFRPRYVLVKRTDSSVNGDWVVYDSARDTYNVAQNYLLPNTAGAEGVFANLDLLSNGFKLKSTASINTSTATYIYAAFAENPFKNALAR